VWPAWPSFSGKQSLVPEANAPPATTSNRLIATHAALPTPRRALNILMMLPPCTRLRKGRPYRDRPYSLTAFLSRLDETAREVNERQALPVGSLRERLEQSGR
jgi:hypothetical protein